MFNGTLNRKWFFKNIEFVQSMFDFSKDKDITENELNPLGFWNFVRSRKREYKNLHKFMSGEIKNRIVRQAQYS